MESSPMSSNNAELIENTYMACQVDIVNSQRKHFVYGNFTLWILHHLMYEKIWYYEA